MPIIIETRPFTAAGWRLTTSLLFTPGDVQLQQPDLEEAWQRKWRVFSLYRYWW
jgi:hypothetical protein